MKKSDIQALLGEGIAAARAGQQERPSQGQTAQKRVYRIAASKAGQRKRARQLLRRVVELDETNIPAWLWLSTVLEELADKCVCLENVLALDPDNKAAKTGLARLQARAAQSKPEGQAPPAGDRAEISPGTMKRPEPAQQATNQARCPFCNQSISIMATNCSHCGLSLVVDCPACQARVDVEQETCSECSRPMGNFRHGPAYFAGLAMAYREHKRHRKALASWQTVETLDPNYPDLYLHLSQAQAAMGQTEAAVANLQQLLEQGSAPLTAYLALGKIFHKSRRWRKGQAVYTQALDSYPKSAPAHFALGWLLMEWGQAKEALVHIRQATRLDSRHGMAWFRLGQLYELAQESRPAIRAYQKAAVLLPDNTIASKKVRDRLSVIDPILSKMMATGWLELTRQLTGPIMICLLAALLDAGLRPWWIPWTGWVALLLATSGAFMWISGATLPRNPVIRLLVGEQGISSSEGRVLVASVGVLCWLCGLGIILFPLGQSLPETPL